ncbi:MAG TPA: sulfatase [Bryobacteraceae bacterium]|jgi:arylsulfatase A-like enzyme
MRQSVLRGAASGFAAWLVYGALETLLSVGAKLHSQPDMSLMPWQWRLIAMLCAVYVAGGAVLGGLAGSLLAATGRAEVPGAYQFAASLTVTLAFGANLIASRPLTGAEGIALAVAALLTIGFLMALFRENTSNRLRWLASPWTVSLLLLGAPWTAQEALSSGHSAVLRGAAALVFLGFVAAGSKFLDRLRGGRIPTAARQLAAGCVVFGIFGGLALVRSMPASIRGPVSAPAPNPASPNVLLITMDTVRADHLPMYGYARDTAPHLREFSQSATLYTRAIAVSDYTLPTHGSIFTGLYPPWHGGLMLPPPESQHQPLRPDSTTLAELLGANGYWAAESVANSAFLAPWTGLTKGFTVSEWERPVDLSPPLHPFYLRERARGLMGRWSAQFDKPFRTATDIRARGEALLAQAKRNRRPFFIFLNYMDAHWPYTPESARLQEIPGRAAHNLTINVNEGNVSLSLAEKEFLISEYDAGIAVEDASIDAVLKRLRALGLYDNTLIIIASDHGEGFMEHGFLDHVAGMTYQENLHVPLLIKYPQQSEGARSDLLVSQVDLLPTILDVAGLPARPGLPGKSLNRAQPSDSDAVFAVARPGVPGKKNPKIQGARNVIVSGFMKLISWTAGPSEMYDLSSDPGEKRNLYSRDDPRAIALNQRLSKWVASMPPLKRNAGKMDKSTMERLRSLGYTQ